MQQWHVGLITHFRAKPPAATAAMAPMMMPTFAPVPRESHPPLLPEDEGGEEELPVPLGDGVVAPEVAAAAAAPVAAVGEGAPVAMGATCIVVVAVGGPGSPFSSALQNSIMAA